MDFSTLEELHTIYRGILDFVGIAGVEIGAISNVLAATRHSLLLDSNRLPQPLSIGLSGLFLK